MSFVSSHRMDNATRLFIEVWNRLTHDWSRVLTFHQMGTIGQDSARDAIHRSHLNFVQHSLLHGEYKNLLKDPEGFVRDGFADRALHTMTEAAVTTYRQTLDAASLVFAHSILDAVMFDCLRICARSAPQDWLTLLRERKVGIADVAAKSFPDLLRETIDAELARLERQSLLKKFDRLIQLCQPKEQVYLANGFRFDRDRLVALDNLRHEIVHDPGKPKPQASGSLHEDLEFMRNCGLHVFVIIHERFGLVFSGREVVQVLSDRYRAPPNEPA